MVKMDLGYSIDQAPIKIDIHENVIKLMKKTHKIIRFVEIYESKS
jgi:hypothetical protein